MNANTPADAKDMKAAVRTQWNSAAAGWNDHTPSIRAWLARATSAMLDMAGVKSGSSVIDIAAGAGDQTIDAAQRVGPTGRVCATDLSPVILEHAAANAKAAGLANVQTCEADAEALPFGDGTFDAALCRLGLMLCLNPAAALREMHRVLKPGGGACTVVFSGPETNPCVAILIGTAMKHAGLPPREPFQPGGLLSLGKPGHIDSLFAAAGFREIATTRLDAPYRLPSAQHYLDFVRASASPIQQILGRLDEKARLAAWTEMEERLRAFEATDGWIGPNELLLTAARK